VFMLFYTASTRYICYDSTGCVSCASYGLFGSASSTCSSSGTIPSDDCSGLCSTCLLWHRSCAAVRGGAGAPGAAFPLAPLAVSVSGSVCDYMYSSGSDPNSGACFVSDGSYFDSTGTRLHPTLDGHLGTSGRLLALGSDGSRAGSRDGGPGLGWRLVRGACQGSRRRAGSPAREPARRPRCVFGSDD